MWEAMAKAYMQKPLFFPAVAGLLSSWLSLASVLRRQSPQTYFLRAILEVPRPECLADRLFYLTGRLFFSIHGLAQESFVKQGYLEGRLCPSG